MPKPTEEHIVGRRVIFKSSDGGCRPTKAYLPGGSKANATDIFNGWQVLSIKTAWEQPTGAVLHASSAKTQKRRGALK